MTAPLPPLVQKALDLEIAAERMEQTELDEALWCRALSDADAAWKIAAGLGATPREVARLRNSTMRRERGHA